MAVILRNADSGEPAEPAAPGPGRGLSEGLATHLLASRPDRRDSLSAGSGIASVLLHALGLVLFFWLTGATLEASADGSGGPGNGLLPGGGGGGGSGGGEEITYLTIPAPPAPKAEEAAAEVVEETTVPVQPTVPVPTVPEMAEIPKLATSFATTTSAVVRTADAGLGTGAGTGAGSGTGSGTGSGSGSGSGDGVGSGTGSGTGPGAGGRAFPPSPRALMLPPQAPSSVKGKSVTVRLAVDSAGVVQNVDLAPGSGDGDFDKKLRETAKHWLFRPARDAAGRAVAAVFEVVFSF